MTEPPNVEPPKLSRRASIGYPTPDECDAMPWYRVVVWSLWLAHQIPQADSPCWDVPH